MDGILLAEGWSYVISHFEDNGFIHYEDAQGAVFAYHSDKSWEEVEKLVNSQWGKSQVWDNVKFLLSTKMKNGKTNYVFNIH